MKMNKKGIIENLQALIVPLIAIAIILVVGFLIFDEAKDQITERTGNSTITRNETLTGYVNGSAFGLTNGGNCMSVSCSEVVNSSTILAATNSTATIWSCGLDGITVYNHTEMQLGSLNVTYSCKGKSLAYNATSDIQNATQDIPGWLPIIVITIIGALLIGLVANFRAKQ